MSRELVRCGPQGGTWQTIETLKNEWDLKRQWKKDTTQLEHCGKILICWLLIKKRRVFVLMSIFHWALHVKRPSTHWPEKWIFFHSPFPEFSSKLKAQFTHTQRFFDIVSHIYWWCFAVCGAMTSGRTRGIRSWCDNTTRQEPFVVTTRWWWPGQKHW